MPFIRTAPTRPLQPIVRAYLRRRGMGQDTTATLPTDIFSGSSSTDTSGNTYATLPNVFSGTPTTSPSPLTTLLQNIPGLAVTGVNLFQQLQGPALVPGTQAIYNPATGQYYNPSTGQVVYPTGQSVFGGFNAAGLTSYMPVILIGGGLLVVAMMFGGKH